MALFLLGSMLLLVTSLEATSCPNRETMANFDQERFFGLWHNVREPNREWPGWDTIKCSHSLLRHGEGGAINTRYMYLNGTSGAYTSINGSMSRPADSTHGNIEGRFGDEQVPMKYYVLGTDYHNYAVVWLCRQKPYGEEGNIEFAVVMSRHKTLDQAHLDTANSLLPEGEYRDSNQSDCPHHEHGEHAGHGHGGHASHEHGGHASHEHGEHASHEHGGHASHEHGGHAGHGHDH